MILLLLLLPQFASAHSAIAYSDNKDETWAVFADWNRPSATLAEDAALAGCKNKSGKFCKIVKTANSLCHSIAISNEGGAAWGLGQAINQRDAQDQSIVKCLQKDPYGSCVVRKSFCDTFPSGFVPDDAKKVNGVPVPVQPGDHPCRSPKDYDACISAIGPQGTAQDKQDRIRYCKMAFC